MLITVRDYRVKATVRLQTKESFKARFIRRTFHEPNLIIWFGACKDRRMNQLGSTDLYLGRPAVLFDCASRIERQKFDFDSYVELYMCRTKCIRYA